ncbi:hypothetical protein [Paenibacillus protaetiae]|uniref:Uncharacterized protein n=1 Tax=Paenibacillus protaetiae TaxID=2509456 RepID=A0A4P6F1U2_9BACL|nr:hypothetical protein [Paenibacillus protaetiae]QAY68099.1 hypothetical protein ET464_18720 [Paenibacillus protaetiae]
MSEQVHSAVVNNIVWCGIICETHGITAASSKHVWSTTAKAPPFYPDIITSSRHATVKEVIDIIGNREVSSIKDSFANLDMSPLDFEILFKAEWIYHAPLANLEPIPSGWHEVTAKNDFVDWTLAHGSGNVIKPELLNRRDVKMYAYTNKGETAGFIANLGGNAVGISNVFSSVNSNNLWSDIHTIASLDFPGLPTVGYEQGDDLAAALQSGWTSAGPLRVWVKSKNY